MYITPMSLTQNEDNTRSKYNQNAPEWLKASGGEKRPCYWPKEMELFVELLKGDKVLDLGSGPATDSTYLKEFGLSVYSTDYSRGMLNIGKKLNPSLSLIESDTYASPFSDNAFDGIWFCASLLHLEHPEKALAEVNRLLKPEGVCFVSVKQGEGEKIDEKTGYYFNYFNSEELESLFESAGFSVVFSAVREGTPNHPWLTYHLKKN